MSLTAAVSGFVILLLTVRVVQGQKGWEATCTPTPKICALKGSTVEIRCTYRYSSTIKKVENKFWFRKETNNVYVDLRTDLEYSGRVEYICENNNCILRITDLRESDSAEYKFRFTTNQEGGRFFGQPGVTLSVTDLQVQVSRSEVYQSSNRAELKCRSKCRLPGHPFYVWSVNGQNILGPTSNPYSVYLHPTNNHSCAAKGYEKFPSPPVYAPKLPSVSASPSAELMEGSSVNLTCTCDANPAANYTWYKKNKNPDHEGLSEEPQLVFSFIQSSDSGEYYCTAENELGTKTSEYIFINVKFE